MSIFTSNYLYYTSHNRIVCCFIRSGAVITRSTFTEMITIDTHSSPARARYGVSIVTASPDLCSASVIIVLYVLSCCIRPRNNDTSLYMKYKECDISYGKKEPCTIYKQANIHTKKKSMNRKILQYIKVFRQHFHYNMAMRIIGKW